MLNPKSILLLILATASASGEDFDDFSILIWDNSTSEHIPVFSIHKETNLISIQAVNMLPLVKRVDDPAWSEATQNLMFGSFGPLNLDDLSSDEVHIL